MTTDVHQQFWSKPMLRQWLTGFILAIMSWMNLPAATAQHAKSDQRQGCESGKKKAQADLKAGKPKYYVFGIVPAKEEARQLVKEQTGIELINMGCMVAMAESCYNEVINDWAKAKTGKTVAQLMQHAVAK